jgi:hypothetical protein
LALQRKQMVEALLYRTWIKETSNIVLQARFIYDHVNLLAKCITDNKI